MKPFSLQSDLTSVVPGTFCIRGAVSSPSDSDNALPISKISRAFDSFHSALQLFAEATNESEAVITKQREDLKKEKRDHEALKVEFDQYKQSMSSLFDENNMRYKQVTNAADAKIERLQRDNENLRKFKEKSTGHRLERIHELKVDELNQLAHDLNAGLEDVQKERDTRRKCVICLENLKNTYFIDGCDHIVLCSDCEGKMANKRCPVCRAPFSETKRLHISHGFLF